MHYKTIFLSDIHLGTKGCSAEELLDFLKNNEAEKIYLIGDIIDCWGLVRKLYWPQTHNDVVQKLLRKSRKGTNIKYIIGNHDDFLRPFVGNSMGNIDFLEEDIHITADGKKILVLHGDKFDGVAKYQMWLAKLGSAIYDWLIDFNRVINFVRRQFGLPYWSFSAFCKRNVKEAVSFVSNFEDAVSTHCKERGYDGIICGHIHHGEISYIDNILYLNTSDWVETRGAIVELDDGTFQFIKFKELGIYDIKIELFSNGLIEKDV